MSAEAPAAVPLVGNFVGPLVQFPQDELFTYRPGEAADTLTSFSNDGNSGGTVRLSVRRYSVNGSYRPVVGDFDGDLRDEIIWYGPGAAGDSMWDFDEAGNVTSVPLAVGGNYRPVAVDLTNRGFPGVLWYAPGLAQDYLWEIRRDASGRLFHTSGRRTISGDYTPVVGTWMPDSPLAGSPGDYLAVETPDVFWYAAGPATDYAWDIRPDGTVRTQTFAVGAGYRPFTVNIADNHPTQIWWYSPTNTDGWWYYYRDGWITTNSHGLAPGPGRLPARCRQPLGRRTR